MKRCFFVLAVALAAAGCRLEFPPIAACHVVDYAAGADKPAESELTRTQIAALSTWLKNKQGAWEFEVVDMYPFSGIVFRFEYAKGRKGGAQLVGNKLYSTGRSLTMNDEELAEFLAILDPEKRLPVFTRAFGGQGKPVEVR